MSWLEEVSSRPTGRDDRPVERQFLEDVVLVERDVDTGEFVRTEDDGEVWVTACASYDALGHVLDHAQLRGRTLRSRVPGTVGIRYRPTRTLWDEVTIRWPRTAPEPVSAPVSDVQVPE